MLFSFWDKTACRRQRNFARISTNEQTSNVEIIRRNEFFHDRWARETWSGNDQPLNFKVTSTAKRTRIVFQDINVSFFTELSFHTKIEEKWNFDHLFVANKKFMYFRAPPREFPAIIKVFGWKFLNNPWSECEIQILQREKTVIQEELDSLRSINSCQTEKLTDLSETLNHLSNREDTLKDRNIDLASENRRLQQQLTNSKFDLEQHQEKFENDNFYKLISKFHTKIFQCYIFYHF